MISLVYSHPFIISGMLVGIFLSLMRNTGPFIFLCHLEDSWTASGSNEEISESKHWTQILHVIVNWLKWSGLEQTFTGWGGVHLFHLLRFRRVEDYEYQGKECKNCTETKSDVPSFLWDHITAFSRAELKFIRGTAVRRHPSNGLLVLWETFARIFPSCFKIQSAANPSGACLAPSPEISSDGSCSMQSLQKKQKMDDSFIKMLSSICKDVRSDRRMIFIVKHQRKPWLLN